MAMTNTITIKGCLGRDAEVWSTNAGRQVASCSLAHSQGRNKDSMSRARYQCALGKATTASKRALGSRSTASTARLLEMTSTAEEASAGRPAGRNRSRTILRICHSDHQRRAPLPSARCGLGGFPPVSAGALEVAVQIAGSRAFHRGAEH